jgi:hypothetical protein
MKLACTDGGHNGCCKVKIFLQQKMRMHCYTEYPHTFLDSPLLN